MISVGPSIQLNRSPSPCDHAPWLALTQTHAAHHSASAPLAVRQLGECQRCPFSAALVTASSSTSIPSPGPASRSTIPIFTEIPTAAAEGYDLEFGSWGGLYAPKGIPADIKAALEAALEKAAQAPEFTDVITATGTLAEYKNSSDWTTFVGVEYERFGQVLGN